MIGNQYKKAMMLFAFSFLTLLTGRLSAAADKMHSRDSVAIQLLIDKGRGKESANMAVAGSYYIKAYRIAMDMKYDAGMVKAIHNITYVLNNLGKYDSALMLNLRAVTLSEKINDSVNLAKALFNTGSSYRFLGQYEQAARYYHRGSILFLHVGNNEMWGQANDLLQLLSHDLHQYDKGIEYGEKAVSALKSSNDKILYGNALINLGINYVSAGEYSLGKQAFDKVLDIGRKTGNPRLEIPAHLNIGDLAIRRKQWDILKANMLKALNLSVDYEDRESELIARKGLAIYYLNTSEYDLAEENALEALRISRSTGLMQQQQKLYSLLSSISYALGKVDRGDFYSGLEVAVADSLLNESIVLKAEELEKKFRSEHAATQIRLLSAEKLIKQKEIKHKNLILILLLVSLAGMSFTAFLIYKSSRQSKQIQQQRISELETEKQLAASEAVIKGEEQERRRLARDLHDGLGGLLSGIRHSFGSIKERLVLTEENQLDFERSIDMLDSSIREMRRVAHNMMPESLHRFGLNDALQDFCQQISDGGALKINYQVFGDAGPQLSTTISITIYRIVQELISNSIKHSGASQALVQLNYSRANILVTVEDNGKGFEPSILKNSSGIGWANIVSRVEYLKGKLDISSSSENGTSVIIEIARS